MSDLTFKFLDKPSDKELEEVRKVRIKVFVDEQGFELGNENDKHDSSCWHIEVSLKGNVIGTSRMVFHDDAYFMGRVAILKEHRGKGYGREMFNQMVEESKRRGYSKIKVESQMHVVEMYEKYGFDREGPVFIIEGAEHQRMCLNL